MRFAENQIMSRIALKMAISLAMITTLTSCGYVEKNKNESIVIAFGSSSMYQMDSYLREQLESRKIKFINASIGGQIIETMSALQGSNPVYLKFNNNIILSQGAKNNVDVMQKNLNILNPKGYFEVTLSGGHKGYLNLSTKTFRLIDNNENPIYANKPLLVDFNYFGYEENAIHIFNIGKNNITMGQYTADQIFNSIAKMVDFIQENGNQRFIVCGFFINQDMSLNKKKIVLDVNSRLNKKYNNQYLDMQDWITSKTIWSEVDIHPTKVDLTYQGKGELAPSLSSNPSHVNERVSSEFSLKIIKKLKDLDYI